MTDWFCSRDFVLFQFVRVDILINWRKSQLLTWFGVGLDHEHSLPFFSMVCLVMQTIGEKGSSITMSSRCCWTLAFLLEQAPLPAWSFSLAVFAWRQCTTSCAVRCFASGGIAWFGLEKGGELDETVWFTTLLFRLYWCNDYLLSANYCLALFHPFLSLIKIPLVYFHVF